MRKTLTFTFKMMDLGSDYMLAASESTASVSLCKPLSLNLPASKMGAESGDVAYG